jgi:hypothetical protein
MFRPKINRLTQKFIQNIRFFIVMPVKTGIQELQRLWIPAFAGMTRPHLFPPRNAGNDEGGG